MGGDSQKLELEIFNKAKVPIVLCRNGSYDDMIAKVTEASDLACESSDLVIS